MPFLTLIFPLSVVLLLIYYSVDKETRKVIVGPSVKKWFICTLNPCSQMPSHSVPLSLWICH